MTDRIAGLEPGRFAHLIGLVGDLLAAQGDPETPPRSAVDHVDAHNATRGCFAARVERD